MRVITNFSFFLIVVLSLLSCSNEKEKKIATENPNKPVPQIVGHQENDSCLIESGKIGDVSVTDSIESIKQKIPNGKLSNAADGDGVDWLVIEYSNIKINVPDNDFKFLQVDDPICKTSENVRVGMTIEDIAKVYGAVKQVRRNDANVRQEVVFTNNPEKIHFYGYDLGIFANNEQQTKKYASDGVVEFIAVVAD